MKKPNNSDRFSLVNLTFDDKGRLLVSREGGPVLLCSQPDGMGVFTRVKPYCEQVRNCQGMCWIKDALFLVGDGPQGTGLYRVRDSRGLDKTDEVKLLHKFVGAMGEHGPHAILHGPDGWLYVVVGNGGSPAHTPGKVQVCALLPDTKTSVRYVLSDGGGRCALPHRRSRVVPAPGSFRPWSRRTWSRDGR